MKQRAVELRKKGLTYQQIVDELGVTLDWCKKNMKGVKKDSQLVTEACLQELVAEATRPEGITVYEANAIIFKHHKDRQLNKDQIRGIRDKAKDVNNECLFRPPWVDATAPTKSYKTMIAYTTHLLDELEAIVDSYCEEHPSVNRGSVKYEILKHLYPKISGEPLSGRMMRNENVVEILEDRKINYVLTGDELEIDTMKTDTQVDIGVKDSDLVDGVLLTDAELDQIWG